MDLHFMVLTCDSSSRQVCWSLHHCQARPTAIEKLACPFVPLCISVGPVAMHLVVVPCTLHQVAGLSPTAASGAP